MFNPRGKNKFKTKMAGAPDPYADIDFDEVQCESVKFSEKKHLKLKIEFD